MGITRSRKNRSLTEAAFLHGFVEIDVGGGHQPEVRLDRAGAADSLDFAFLNRPEQLGLQVSLISPISSRNSVPPEASSNLPSAGVSRR